MEKFYQVAPQPITEDKIQSLAKHLNMTSEQVKEFYEDNNKNAQVFENNEYQVHKRIFAPFELFSTQSLSVIHLSIKRLDKEPVHDWRILQQIKNYIAGDKIEMWECYPKESQLVDTANQYHLWGFNTTQKVIPFGFYDGRHVIDHDPEAEKSTGTKQRKL
jgi:hypothetical protein